MYINVYYHSRDLRWDTAKMSHFLGSKFVSTCLPATQMPPVKRIGHYVE